MDDFRGSFMSMLRSHQDRGRYAHVINFGVADDFDRIKDRGEFCKDNFGPDAITYCDRRDIWLYDDSGIWTFMERSYYFDNEEDAVAFSLYAKG